MSAPPAPIGNGWLEVEVVCARARAQAAGEALETVGAVSVSLTDAGDEALFEPPPGAAPLWRATRVTGLFPAGADAAALRARLGARLGPGLVAAVTFRPLVERDWGEAWREHFRATRFGRRLWVVPSDEACPDPGGAVVRLDPGLAFGTGNHPSTARCLEWLDAEPLAGRRVLDYGCGSGILAVAALVLGAASAVAVDIDPQALVATRANAGANGVRARITVLEPRRLAEVEVDVLVANILSGPLKALAGDLAGRVVPGGRIALAGLLSHQADEVATAYRPWFDLEPPRLAEGWCLLAGTRKAGP